MIFLKLFFAFIKIGLFSFGGGYAMIPLIQKEILSNGWLTQPEFIDIIAIAEMTPGPIAINSATFVGYRTAGIAGGVAATLGVVFPSFVLVLAVSQFFFRFKRNPLNTMLFYGIKPVIAGLIVTATVFVAETALFNRKLDYEAIREILSDPSGIVNVGSIVIFVLTLLAVKKLKLHPILGIIGSGVLGILFFTWR